MNRPTNHAVSTSNGIEPRTCESVPFVVKNDGATAGGVGISPALLFTQPPSTGEPHT